MKFDAESDGDAAGVPKPCSDLFIGTMKSWKVTFSGFWGEFWKRCLKESWRSLSEIEKDLFDSPESILHADVFDFTHSCRFLGFRFLWKSLWNDVVFKFFRLPFKHHLFPCTCSSGSSRLIGWCCTILLTYSYTALSIRAICNIASVQWLTTHNNISSIASFYL